MSKLTENFNRLNLVEGKLSRLEDEILEFEIDNKDNEILKKYIELLHKKESYEKEIDNSKDVLYKGMLEEDIDILNGKYVDVTLKRPYTRLGLDKEAFLKDNPVGSKLYNKYMKETTCKGNITIKLV